MFSMKTTCTKSKALQPGQILRYKDYLSMQSLKDDNRKSNIQSVSIGDYQDRSLHKLLNGKFKK